MLSGNWAVGNYHLLQLGLCLQLQPWKCLVPRSREISHPTVNSEQLWNNPKQALNLALDLVLLSGLSLESHSLKRYLGGQGERAEAMGARD